MRRASALRPQTLSPARLHLKARNSLTPIFNARSSSAAAQAVRKQDFPPPPPNPRSNVAPYERQSEHSNQGRSGSQAKIPATPRPIYHGRGSVAQKRIRVSLGIDISPRRAPIKKKTGSSSKSNAEAASRETSGRSTSRQRRVERRGETTHGTHESQLSSPGQDKLQYDEATLKRTLKLPPSDQIPEPLGDNSERAISWFNESAQSGLCQIDSRESKPFSNAFGLNLTLSLLDGQKIEAIGEGMSKVLAKRAAYLHLLAKVFEQGRLRSIFPDKHDSKTMKAESHAKLDVYIFAAKYGMVPQFSTQKSKHLRKSPASIEAIIELPELGIKTIGRSRRLVTAELSASINFKKEIERLLSTSSSSLPVVDESLTLTPAIASSFFTWYKQKFRSSPQLYVESSQESGMDIAQAFLKDVAGKKTPVGDAVRMPSKRSAEDVATLTAALHFTRDQPEMLNDFFREFRKNNNQILAPIGSLDFEITDEVLTLMQDIITSAPDTGSGRLAKDFEKSFDIRTSSGTMYRTLSPYENSARSKELQRKLEDYEKRESLATLRQTRADYPMNQYTEEVLEIVHKNLYSIIIGATGSGKTTQVPQILLNDAINKGHGAKCNIICTQPRRIAAKSVSVRVAEERAEDLGDSVGYHVRREIRSPKLGGSINYCTTGILTQQLQFAADEIMENVTHLIIDEVHERDIIIDFLLTALKKLVAERIARGKRVPHIVLMSATIDSELFANYFTSDHPEKGRLDCPTLSVPGRTFPVKEKHLNEVLMEISEAHGQSALHTINGDKDSFEYIESEKTFMKTNGTPLDGTDEAKDEADFSINWKMERGKALQKAGLASNELEESLVPHSLVATTVAHLAKTTKEGAILVFLPGLENITKIGDILNDERPLGLDFRDTSKYRIFMLHSSIPNTQTEVFEPMQPGCRKIILSTNIAETSVTIPDVQYVVDTGKLREKQYDQMRRITRLACIWASKSNTRQRAGRAGRVQNGNYYALYGKERFQSLRAVGLPELLRSDLQEVCLDVKSQGFQMPAAQFLADSLEPPTPEAVNGALESLKALECLTADERLTPLGRLLASLPIHPSLGKMIILGIIFRCLDPIIILGSSFNERSLFINSIDNAKAANAARKAFTQNTGSDHIGLLNAIREMRYIDETRGPRALQDFGLRNFLHLGAYRSILGTSETIDTILSESNITPRTPKYKRAQFQFGDPSLNVNSDKVPLIKALTLTGFWPNIGVNYRGPLYRTPGENETLVHPSSIHGNWRKGRGAAPAEKPKQEKLLAYSSMNKSNDGLNTYLREVSPITPLIAALFGGRITSEYPNSRNIKMDDWLPFFIKSSNMRAPRLFKDFRDALDRVKAQSFADLFKRANLAHDPARATFAMGLVELLQLDGTDPNAPRGSKWDRFMEGLTSSSERRGAHQGNSWDDLMDTWVGHKPTRPTSNYSVKTSERRDGGGIRR